VAMLLAGSWHAWHCCPTFPGMPAILHSLVLHLAPDVNCHTQGHYVIGVDWKRNEHMPVRPPPLPFRKP